MSPAATAKRQPAQAQPEPPAIIEPKRCEPELIRDRWHRYKIGDEPVFPSVTTIIGKMEKPALKFWAAKLVAEHVAGLKQQIDADPDNDELVAKVWEQLGDVEALKRVPEDYKSDRADVGTKFHIVSERFQKGQPVNTAAFEEEVRARCDMFLTLLERFRPTIRWIEFPALYRSVLEGVDMRYAGTGDAIWDVDFGDGLGHVPTLIDHKTSESSYTPGKNRKIFFPIEHPMQLLALASCQTIYDTTAMEEVPMPKVERLAVIDAKAASCRVWVWPSNPAILRAFLGLRHVWALEKLLGDIRPVEVKVA